MSGAAPPSGSEASPIGASAPLTVLRQRSDFLKAASARRFGTAGFLLQGRQRDAAEPAQGIRVGFTCSKKIGNAVTRNRAKRRLRAVARALLPGLARPGWDYVLVGRPEATVSRDFAALTDDLRQAMGRIHDAPRGDRAGGPPGRGRRRGKGTS